MDGGTALVLYGSIVLNIVLFIALVWQRDQNDRLLDRIERGYPLVDIDDAWNEN